MKPLKAFTKQLFGARYERITKSLLGCFILFLALSAAQIRIAIAPSVLFLTATALSFGGMGQGIGSAGNADWMMGLFALPFSSRGFVASYLLAFSGYTFLTRGLPVLTILGTIGAWNGAQIGTALLCAGNGCVLAAAWRAMMDKKHRFLPVFWGCGVLFSIFFVKQLGFLCGMIVISMAAAVWYLLITDAYVFYRPVPAGKRRNRTCGKGNVLRYLLRYLFANKSYLMNTVGLWAVACFLPFVLGTFEGLNAMPLGFAILCLNTPLGILLSCDPGLEQAVRMLPGQAMRFCGRYGLFIFTVNLTTNGIYLVSWKMKYGGVGGLDILTAVLFALQSAILSILLEWWCPVRNWKTESDLWHHPRKYLVPLLMMVLAVAAGTRPLFVWIWLSIVLGECCVLLFIARRM